MARLCPRLERRGPGARERPGGRCRLRLKLALLLCLLPAVRECAEPRGDGPDAATQAQRLARWRAARHTADHGVSGAGGSPGHLATAVAAHGGAAGELVPERTPVRREDWTTYSGSWERMLISAQDAADGIMHVNDAALCQSPGDETDPEDESDQIREVLALPVYVLNLPTKPERRSHMACLLQSLGFRSIEFPPVAERNSLHDINPYLLDVMRQSPGCNAEEPLACLACCLSHLNAHKLARSRGHKRCCAHTGSTRTRARAQTHTHTHSTGSFLDERERDG